MKIIGIYNIKGGVGKTATTVNLAYLASKEEKPTLICDMDPQGATSFYFRIKAARKFSKKKLLKGGKNIEKNIKGTDFPYLDLLPADLSYRNLDLALDDMKKSQKRLKQLFEPFEDEYDYVFIDSPPNITLLSENIFNAVDMLLVPVVPTTLSTITFQQLQDFFKESGFSKSKIYAFFSMVEKRKSLHRETMTQFADNKRFLQSYIPYASAIERMGITREPVVRTNPNILATKAFKNLWEEIKRI